MKITETKQKVAADILTQFMFTKTMDDVMKVWKDIYKQYDLSDDPFTGCPCSEQEYCKNAIKYEKQAMIERYGHCDGLE